MGNIWMRFMACLATFAFISTVADGLGDSENGYQPKWQLLTRQNFSAQIQQNDYVLVMVSVPWSGESRALMNDLEQLVKYTNGQFERLQLMLIYRNTERMLGDVLLGGRAITLVFYRHAVPYKYSGKLIAQNILDSVWHVMTVPSGDLPLKQLDTLEDFDSFLQSTDKAVILFDFCGWVQKILTSEKKKTRVFPMEKLDYKYGPDNLNRDELLEKSFTGSFVKQSFDGGKLKQDSGSNNEAIEGNSLGRDRNIQTSPESVSVVAQTDAFASEQGICETGEGSAAGLWKDGLYSATYGNNSMGAGKNMTGMSSWKGNGCPASEDNDDLFHELSCTSDEYKYFEVLHTDLTKIARDNLLPPERQRFGLLSNRTMMCAVGLQLQHAWSLMLQFPDCPNCSKTFNRGGDLKEFVLASQPYVTELQGDGYKLAPPLSTETPSLILFIDRASPSAILRQKSKEALQALRQVAFHYGLSNQSDEGNGRMAGESLLKYYSDGNVRKKTNLPPSNPLQRQVLKSSELSKLMSSGKNMVIQVKTTEGEFQIVNLHRNGESSTGSLLQQRGPTEKLKEYELGLLAKEAGFQLLSSDFETEIQKLFQVPETLSSSSEKETGQVEDLEESLRSQSFDSESYQISGDSAYITDNILSRHNSVSTTHGSGDGDVEQVFEIGLGDDNFYPEGYQNVTVAQDNSVIEEHKQCRNKHSINETLDRSHDEEQCKSEIIENSGDQFSDLSEKPDEEPVAEENVRQKPDIHPEIENVKKEIYLIRGEFANRESTVVYTGEEESFEKHDKNLGKLDDKQDKNYAADILFFYSDGGDQMRRILSPDATIPAVVIIDPVIQEHFVFPNDIPVTYSSLIEFVNAFLNGNLQAHKHSEPFPPSPREPPRPPFVNRDFHEVDSIPRVTLGTFSRLVLGFDDCNQSVETPCANGHRFGAAWRKDVLVLFSNNWCGFCKRLELVVREVHRFFKGCTNILHAEGRIAPNSSFQDILSFSTKMNREKTGDISKDETANNLPSIFHMDCTLNDCSSLLKFSNQWKELYPTLLLFPAGKKDAPIAYEGDMLVNKVIEFVASYGSTSSHLYGVQGILWNKMQQGRGNLNTCAPWMPSSVSIQIQTPLQNDLTGHELLVDTVEQSKGHQFQTENEVESILQKASQKPTTGAVLIATEKLQGVDPFENSIILIIKADSKEGFQGLVVNKPLSWDVLQKLDMQLEPLLRSSPISFGGPIIVNGMPFVCLTQLANLEGFLEVLPGIYFGGPPVTSRIFEMIKSGKIPAHDFWFFLGFVSWGWQQLFDELKEQIWHVNTYREDILRWPA